MSTGRARNAASRRTEERSPAASAASASASSVTASESGESAGVTVTIAGLQELVRRMTDAHNRCKRQWENERDDWSKKLKTAQRSIEVLKSTVRDTKSGGSSEKDAKERIINKTQPVVHFVLSVVWKMMKMLPPGWEKYDLQKKLCMDLMSRMTLEAGEIPEIVYESYVVPRVAMVFMEKRNNYTKAARKLFLGKSVDWCIIDYDRC